MTKLTALTLIEKLLAYGYRTVSDDLGMEFKKPRDYKKHFIRLKASHFEDVYEIEETISFTYDKANNADEIFVDGGLTYYYFDKVIEFEMWTENEEG